MLLLLFLLTLYSTLVSQSLASPTAASKCWKLPTSAKPQRRSFHAQRILNSGLVVDYVFHCRFYWTPHPTALVSHRSMPNLRGVQEHAVSELDREGPSRLDLDKSSSAPHLPQVQIEQHALGHCKLRASMEHHHVRKSWTIGHVNFRLRQDQTRPSQAQFYNYHFGIRRAFDPFRYRPMRPNDLAAEAVSDRGDDWAVVEYSPFRTEDDDGSFYLQVTRLVDYKRQWLITNRLVPPVPRATESLISMVMHLSEECGGNGLVTILPLSVHESELWKRSGFIDRYHYGEQRPQLSPPWRLDFRDKIMNVLKEIKPIPNDDVFDSETLEDSIFEDDQQQAETNPKSQSLSGAEETWEFL